MTLDGFPAASVHLLTAKPWHLLRLQTFYISVDSLLAERIFPFPVFFFSFCSTWSGGSSVRFPLRSLSVCLSVCPSPTFAPPVTFTSLSAGQQVEPRKQKDLLEDVSIICTIIIATRFAPFVLGAGSENRLLERFFNCRLRS